MKCPTCNAQSRVLATRYGLDRRRECLGQVKHRWNTTEVLMPDKQRYPSLAAKSAALGL